MALPALLLGAVRERWAVEHPGSQVVPLFGQVWEPSAQTGVVVVGRGAGAARWAVLRTGADGLQIVLDQPLPTGSTALVAALSGEEVDRLLVVASPRVTALSYSPDGRSEQPMSSDLHGVGGHALQGDPARDRVLVRVGDAVVYDQPAPSRSGDG